MNNNLGMALGFGMIGIIGIVLFIAIVIDFYKQLKNKR